jgi:hypothetical protein
MKAVATVFLLIVGVRFVISLLAGSVENGSAANITMRVVGILALTGAVSFVVAATVDWYERRKSTGL